MNDNKMNNDLNIIDKLSKIIFSKPMTFFLIVISIFMVIIIKDYDRVYHVYRDKTETLELENTNYKSKISEYTGDISKYKKEIDALNKSVEIASPWLELNDNEREILKEKINDVKNEAKIREEERIAKEEAERIAEEKLEEEQRKTEEQRKANQDVDTYKVEREMNTIVRHEISSNLQKTTLDSLTVNENLGTTSNKDVIVLINLSWSRKNTEFMTREMLKTYSDQLAVKMASKLADGSEIALFWDAEYTGLSIKHSYYIKNNEAYIQ